ncbi:hypothetical protein [Mycobacterium sp. 3519A]|uniref:hypothetical protein n=1 Tax=Mycobacterium sp. 3519A TaxID=2057184 RepID=UPI0011575525|nr:hypothetical protein [Mycobacterium sp. 3519A]
MGPTTWKDCAKARVDSLVQEAGSEHRDELAAVLRATLHALIDVTPCEELRRRKIIRLTDVPVVKGGHMYRCLGCGEQDRGNDNDRRHMEWRERHWANCWPE